MKKFKIGIYSNKKKSLQSEPKHVTVDTKHSQKDVTKNSPAKKRKSRKKLVIFLGIILIAFLTFMYYRLQTLNTRVEKYDESGNKIECTNILNPACWTEAFKPQLKQTSGFTNALIVGLDTRAGTNSLKNTDSLIVASFDHKTQQIMLISIPRDFYAYEYRTKINAIYAFTLNKNPEDEFFYLKEYISQLLNLPIHYFATVRFEGVIELVDKLDGIELCLEDSVTAQYPNDNAKPWDRDQWLYYDFVKGCQTVDGEKALVWARFRYVRKGPAHYASDFSRGRRQQQVIDAIKNKVLAEDKAITERAESLWSLYQTLSKSVTLDVSFEDILAALSFIDTADKQPISVVLDPTLGGLNRLIFSESGPATGYIIRAKDKTYKQIQAELANIREFADFYREQPKILVRNQTGEKTLDKGHPAIKLKNETSYYNEFNVFNEAKSDKIFGIKIFDFTAGTKPLSLSFIKNFLGVEEVELVPETYGISRSKNNEDFVIVVGPPEPPPTQVPTSAPAQ